MNVREPKEPKFTPGDGINIAPALRKIGAAVYTIESVEAVENMACALAFDLGVMEAERDEWESVAVKMEEAIIRNFGWLNLEAVTPGAGMCFHPDYCIPGHEPGGDEAAKPPESHFPICELVRVAHSAFEVARKRRWRRE